MMWLSLHALHALHGKKIERRLTMEDRESMELGTEQMNDVVSLHVLHALHGKKERFSTENMNESGRRKATVTPLHVLHVLHGEKGFELQRVIL